MALQHNKRWERKGTCGKAAVSNGNCDECISAAINIQLTLKDLQGKAINSHSKELFFFFNILQSGYL